VYDARLKHVPLNMHFTVFFILISISVFENVS